MNIGFITVQTKDIDASIDFYQRVLGFTVERRFSPAPGMEIVFLKDEKGGLIEFIRNDRQPAYSGEGISIGFYVEDIEKTAAHLRNQKVEIINGPVTMGNGVKLMQIRDNNGLELGFVQE